MNANLCKNNGFEDLIVSYIYDEATADERRRLETHILDCSSCMEEFAGLSNARLSVFEWQKEAFAGLETPTITIPRALKSNTEAASESASLLDRLGALLAGLRGPAVAFGAVLVLMLGGLGYIFLTKNVATEPQIVSNVPVTTPQKPENIEPIAPISEPKNEVAAKPARSVEYSQPESAPKAEPVKAVVPQRRVRIARNLTAKAEKPRRVSPSNRKAPVLNDFDDTVDSSLRLSDLFDGGVGSIRY